MSHRIKIIKEWVDVQVTKANQTFKGNFEVDKHVSKIIGIAISSNYDEHLYFRGSVKITVTEKEIYPEGYEAKMLLQGWSVPVNDRIIKLGEELDPGNRKVELEYKDNDHSSATFQPYSVRLYVYSRIAE